MSQTKELMIIPKGVRSFELEILVLFFVGRKPSVKRTFILTGMFNEFDAKSSLGLYIGFLFKMEPIEPELIINKCTEVYDA